MAKLKVKFEVYEGAATWRELNPGTILPNSLPLVMTLGDESYQIEIGFEAIDKPFIRVWGKGKQAHPGTWIMSIDIEQERLMKELAQ